MLTRTKIFDTICMAEYSSSLSLIRKVGFNVTILIFFLFGISVITGYGCAEKVPVTIAVGTVPENPGENQAFRITGKLSAESGEVLGNKRLILEKSVRNPEIPGSFSYLMSGETSGAGIFEFFRPAEAGPVYLRVSFSGDDRYAPAVSQVLSVNGAGMNSSDLQPSQTGSITVSTNPSEAEVYVDSVYRGITPVMVTGLPEGSHVVELAKTGYQNETMESYVLPSRGSSFFITLNKGQNMVAYTGISSTVSVSENQTEPKVGYAMGIGGMSSALYISPGDNTDPFGKYELTKIESVNPASGGYDYLVIIKDKDSL